MNRAISVAINAYGTHAVMAHDIPKIPTITDAPWFEDIKNVLNMQAANAQWDSSHMRRRVSPGIQSFWRHRDGSVRHEQLLFGADLVASISSSCAGRMRSGSIIFAVNEMRAFTNKAKVLIRVAYAQVLSISSSLISRCLSNMGSTYSCPI